MLGLRLAGVRHPWLIPNIVMDGIHRRLSLTPLPYLALAFKITWSDAEQAQVSQRQVGALTLPTFSLLALAPSAARDTAASALPIVSPERKVLKRCY